MTVALVESGRTAKRHRLSSILLKQVMAITGVIFVSFVFIHVFGNLKVYQGPEAFNHYAGWLREVGYPLIPKKGVLWALRITLAVSFVLHIVSGLMIYFRGRKARGKKRLRLSRMGNNARLMVPTGLIIGVFVIVHLLDLTIGKVCAPEMFVSGDAYGNLVRSFSRPGMATFYVFTMLLIALHIGHGARTMLQDFGVTALRTRKVWALIGSLLAILILLGNAAIPVMVQAGVVS